MSDNEKNVPKRRFKEFENADAWEQRKLGDVSSKIGSGKTPLGGEKAYKDYGVCLIRSQNVNYGTVNFSDTVYIDVETDEEMKNSRVINGDVLLNITGASIGRSAVYHGFERANVNQHVCIIRLLSDEISPEFVHLNLTSNNGQRQIDSSQAGGAREGLNFQQISKLTFLFPKIEEQEQIGVFFTKLDNLITLHQRKLEKMKALKKAYLTDMFPAEGERKPKLRFAGFTDDWEQHKLGELTDVYDGTHQTPNYKENGIMFLSVENIKTLQSEKYISKEDFEKDFKIYPQKKDVLMTRIGDIGTTNVVESDDPKAYYVSLALLKHKELNPYFLKESISSEAVKKDIWQRTLHIAFPKKINKNEIANVRIIYPKDKDEQGKIGEFFYNLDNLITLHQQKLEKLQNIKKAYLNEMFI